MAKKNKTREEEIEDKAGFLALGLSVVLTIGVFWAIAGIAGIFGLEIDLGEWPWWAVVLYLLVFFLSIFIVGAVIDEPICKWMGVDPETKEIIGKPLMPERFRVRIIFQCAWILVMAWLAAHTGGWWQTFAIIGLVLGCIGLAAGLGAFTLLLKMRGK